MSVTKSSAAKAKKTKAQKLILISPAQALEILQSALHCCQRAGLTIRLDSTPQGLVPTLPSVGYEATPEGVRLALTEN